MYSTSLHLPLSTSLAVLVNGSLNISHNLTRKASVGMYYAYVLITPTTLVCLLFSTAIPTSLFIKQLFFILVIESVDSISRDGPDTPIYIIHYKKRNNSEQENFKRF